VSQFRTGAIDDSRERHDQRVAGRRHAQSKLRLGPKASKGSLDQIALWIHHGLYRDPRFDSQKVVTVLRIGLDKKLSVFSSSSMTHRVIDQLALDLRYRLSLQREQFIAALRGRMQRGASAARGRRRGSFVCATPVGGYAFDSRLTAIKNLKYWGSVWSVLPVHKRFEENTHAEMKACQWVLDSQIQWKPGDSLSKRRIQQHEAKWKNCQFGVSSTICTDCQLMLDSLKAFYRADNIRVDPVRGNWRLPENLITYIRERDISISEAAAQEAVTRGRRSPDRSESESEASEPTYERRAKESKQKRKRLATGQMSERKRSRADAASHEERDEEWRPDS